MLRCRITVHGEGNEIVLSRFARLTDTVITVNGNCGKLSIGPGSIIGGCGIRIFDESPLVEIGGKTAFTAEGHSRCALACGEGAKLSIGSECLIAAGTSIRTGDGHSILDSEGKRINPAKDTTVGRHCWLCEGAVLLKGVTLPENTIVAQRALVTKAFYEAGMVLGGVPAKVLKTGVVWEIKNSREVDKQVKRIMRIFGTGPEGIKCICLC